MAINQSEQLAPAARARRAVCGAAADDRRRDPPGPPQPTLGQPVQFGQHAGAGLEGAVS